MNCLELYQRIIQEFQEPDTKILNILPEKKVNDLLETPDAPAPDWLVQICRENGVRDSFEDMRPLETGTEKVSACDTCIPEEEESPKRLKEMLEAAALEADRRNRA